MPRTVRCRRSNRSRPRRHPLLPNLRRYLWHRRSSRKQFLIHSNRTGLKPVRFRRQKPAPAMAKAWLEIQKRHTLNWLIQGASQHAGLTLHHLVRDDLNALDARLVRYYDQFALLCLLQYWRGLAVLIVGWPPRFWRKAAQDVTHPFYAHPLLAKHGGALSEVAKQRALARCKEKGFSALPVAFSFQVLSLLKRIRAAEAPHREKLLQLAQSTAATIWGIPRERMEVELSTERVIPGHDFRGDNTQAEMLRNCVVGYSGVARRDHELVVIAKGVTWQLLTKELIKGTAELVCLHGLNRLDEETYRLVVKVTDRIDLEPWMLQSGGELWRRLLAALPDGYSIAHMVMTLARLPTDELHAALELVIQESSEAKVRLARLAE